MPRPVDKTETVDLHAPWWSPETDATGRYLERWVVRSEMTQGDQQAMSSAHETKIKLLTGGRNSKQLGEELVNELVRNQMAFGRLYLLLQMTVEVTDETGKPYHVTREFISSLPSRDTEWVNEQMDALYTAEEVVPVLPEDEQRAERVREAAEDGANVDPVEMDGRGVAAKRFRGTREARASG